MQNKLDSMKGFNTERPFRCLTLAYLFLIFGLPAAILVLPFLFTAAWWIKPLACACLPFLYFLLVGLVAGLLSLPHQRAIVPGKFPRRFTHRVYFHRRAYGLCWTTIYYCLPTYYLFLSFNFLKRILFRLFGYRGHMEFTTYPDTWIRDLPLLELGQGVYISNKATMGTNIALANGSILVDKIVLDDGVLIGHLTMLAPGVTLKRKVEIGVGCSIGIKVQIGERSKVGPTCGIDHGSVIGRNVKIGPASYLGKQVIIGDNIIIPPGTIVPAKSHLMTQADVELLCNTAKRVSPRAHPLLAESFGSAVDLPAGGLLTEAL